MSLDAATLQKLLPPSFYVNGQLAVPESEAQSVAQGIQARLDTMPDAQRNLFLAMVRTSADLAPSAGGGETVNISATLDKLEEAAQVIANLPGSTRNILDFLAQALIEQTAEQRKQALTNRLTARETARSELMNQAQQMKDAAAQLMSGAVASLVVGVALSGVAIVASGVSAVQSQSALGKMGTELGTMNTFNSGKADQLDAVAAQVKPGSTYEQLSPAEKAQVTGIAHAHGQGDYDQASATMQKLNMDAQQATNYSTAGQTLNQLGSTAGGSATAWTQADAKVLEAQGTINAAQAQYSEGVADNAKEIQQALEEMVKNVIAFLKELQDAKANQMQALTKV